MEVVLVILLSWVLANICMIPVVLTLIWTRPREEVVDLEGARIARIKKAKMSTLDSSAMSETLSRLSSKEGVLCTILLAATTGSILQSRGTLPAFSGATTTQLSSNSANAEESTATVKSTADEPSDGMAEIARVAYQFVKSAGALVQSLDAQDEAKLLRLRTKRYELVIVPDSKFICVVVHEIRST